MWRKTIYLIFEPLVAEKWYSSWGNVNITDMTPLNPNSKIFDGVSAINTVTFLTLSYLKGLYGLTFNIQLEKPQT